MWGLMMLDSVSESQFPISDTIMRVSNKYSTVFFWILCVCCTFISQHVTKGQSMSSVSGEKKMRKAINLEMKPKIFAQL